MMTYRSNCRYVPKPVRIRKLDLEGLRFPYFVSSDGKVYKQVNNELVMLKGWLHECRSHGEFRGNGETYLRVGLQANTGRKFFYVHRLVLYAFSRQPKPFEIARHGANGVTDNSIENLEWGTHYENPSNRP